MLLELARLAAKEKPDVPVQFIAFGAEEPRGAGDAISAMVALDRVGYVPVLRGNSGGTQAPQRPPRAGREATTRAGQNTTSDHWSDAKADIPAAGVGRLMWTWLTNL